MMSTGLQCGQFGGRYWLRYSIVASDNVAIVSPRSAARSAAITPGPPPLVTTASRLPTGRNPHDNAFAAVNNCVMVCTRTTPAPVSYTHLRAHETRHDLVCRLLLEKK